MSIQPLPHTYESKLLWKEGREGVLEAPPRPPIQAGPPPEFGGTDTIWSAEHLLVSAANACLMMTFMALAEKAKVGILKYESRVEGVLDRMPEGPVFTLLTFHVDLETQLGQEEAAERLLEKAKKLCLISNSLKAPSHLVVSVKKLARKG